MIEIVVTDMICYTSNGETWYEPCGSRTVNVMVTAR